MHASALPSNLGLVGPPTSLVAGCGNRLVIIVIIAVVGEPGESWHSPQPLLGRSVRLPLPS